MNISRSTVPSSIYTGRANATMTAASGIRAAAGNMFRRLTGGGQGVPNMAVYQGGSRIGSIFVGIGRWLQKTWSNITNIGNMLRAVTKARAFLYNYNWNMSDKQIDQRQEGLITGLAGQWGEAAGTAVASRFVGGLASESLLKMQPKCMRTDPSIAGKLRQLQKLSWKDPEGIYEEAIDNLKAALRSSKTVATGWAFMEMYQNGRKWIKTLNAQQPGGGNATVAKWGEENSDPFSFSGAVEKWTDTMPPLQKAFTSEAIEAFMTEFDRSLLVVASAF